MNACRNCGGRPIGCLDCQTADRRGHLTVISNPTPQRRNHPSMLPPREPYDGAADPLPLTVTARQLIASFVRQWAAGIPVNPEDANHAIDLLMGVDGDGGAA